MEKKFSYSKPARTYEYKSNSGTAVGQVYYNLKDNGYGFMVRHNFKVLSVDSDRVISWNMSNRGHISGEYVRVSLDYFNKSVQDGRLIYDRNQ